MKYRFYQSPIHGLGCIANRDIKKGEIINEEPFFKFGRNASFTVLNDYFWNYKGDKYLINGLGSYANHSNENNCKPVFSQNVFSTRLIPFIALKDIKKDEEILANYGEAYWKSRNKQKGTDKDKVEHSTQINYANNSMFSLYPR